MKILCTLGDSLFLIYWMARRSTIIWRGPKVSQRILVGIGIVSLWRSIWKIGWLGRLELILWWVRGGWLVILLIGKLLRPWRLIMLALILLPFRLRMGGLEMTLGLRILGSISWCGAWHSKPLKKLKDLTIFATPSPTLRLMSLTTWGNTTNSTTSIRISMKMQKREECRCSMEGRIVEDYLFSSKMSNMVSLLNFCFMRPRKESSVLLGLM